MVLEKLEGHVGLQEFNPKKKRKKVLRVLEERKNLYMIMSLEGRWESSA